MDIDLTIEGFPNVEAGEFTAANQARQRQKELRFRVIYPRGEGPADFPMISRLNSLIPKVAAV